MDLKALRTPVHSAHDLATARAGTQARVPRLIQAATKPERTLEPVARTELWRRYYASAVRDGHTEPEKFADTAVRARELALKTQSKRHRTVMLTETPKPAPTEVAGRQAKPAPKSTGPRCQAKTLEGRQCGFAATCGPFCKKHAPKEPLRPSFQLVTDSRRFVDVRLKGYINAPPVLVERVLGKPNGASDEKIEKEWKGVFSDGCAATLFYTHEDPALCVCGEDVGVIGRVRQLLAL